jgi:hypothetical protein
MKVLKSGAEGATMQVKFQRKFSALTQTLT